MFSARWAVIFDLTGILHLKSLPVGDPSTHFLYFKAAQVKAQAATARRRAEGYEADLCSGGFVPLPLVCELDALHVQCLDAGFVAGRLGEGGLRRGE